MYILTTYRPRRHNEPSWDGVSAKLKLTQVDPAIADATTTLWERNNVMLPGTVPDGPLTCSDELCVRVSHVKV
jgi:hypothetical protein